MNDDIDQLLKNLKLRRLREIVSDELERAEKRKPSYTEFLARVLREEYQHQQERFLEYRIDRANLPERWTLESFPWKKQPSVSKVCPRSSTPGSGSRAMRGYSPWPVCQRARNLSQTSS